MQQYWVSNVKETKTRLECNLFQHNKMKTNEGLVTFSEARYNKGIKTEKEVGVDIFKNPHSLLLRAKFPFPN